MGSKFTVQKLKSIMQKKKKYIHIRERERDNRLESLHLSLTVENWREKNNTAGIKLKKKKIFIRRFRGLGFVGFRDLWFVKF